MFFTWHKFCLYVAVSTNHKVNILKSSQMHLNYQERAGLPFFGKTGRLAMGWACYLNQWRYPILEEIFESIAATRVDILNEWFATISQISKSASASGSQLQGVAQAADQMRASLGELNFAVASSREGAQKLRLLVNQFQITETPHRKKA